jgi:hypothetical protein
VPPHPIPTDPFGSWHVRTIGAPQAAALSSDTPPGDPSPWL